MTNKFVFYVKIFYMIAYHAKIKMLTDYSNIKYF